MKRKLDKAYHNLSDEALMAIFDSIGSKPEHRVKKTGIIKLRAAKFGDQILDFIKARRAAAPDAPTKLFVGRRENIIAEIGGSSSIYEGKYLVCPDGPANYDCLGAANITEARAIVEEHRAAYPAITVVYV